MVNAVERRASRRPAASDRHGGPPGRGLNRNAYRAGFLLTRGARTPDRDGHTARAVTREGEPMNTIDGQDGVQDGATRGTSASDVGTGRHTTRDARPAR